MIPQGTRRETKECTSPFQNITSSDETHNAQVRASRGESERERTKRQTTERDKAPKETDSQQDKDKTRIGPTISETTIQTKPIQISTDIHDITNNTAQVPQRQGCGWDEEIPREMKKNNPSHRSRECPSNACPRSSSRQSSPVPHLRAPGVVVGFSGS